MQMTNDNTCFPVTCVLPDGYLNRFFLLTCQIASRKVGNGFSTLLTGLLLATISAGCMGAMVVEGIAVGILQHELVSRYCVLLTTADMEVIIVNYCVTSKVMM